MRTSAVLLFVFVSVLTARASEPMALWPKGAPGEKGDIGVEQDTSKPGEGLVGGKRVVRLGNVSIPTLTLYRPQKGKDTGAAVVVCPGGGYNILAMDLEGTEVCQWLNSAGVTAVLLKYRVPARQESERYAAPLQDAQRALGLVADRLYFVFLLLFGSHFDIASRSFLHTLPCNSKTMLAQLVSMRYYLINEIYYSAVLYNANAHLWQGILMLTFKPHESFHYIQQYIPEKPIIVEAGAFDGHETQRMLAVWPNATIHTFEPIPAVFKKLEANTAHLPNVHRYQIALSDTTGTFPLYVAEKPDRPDIPSQASSLRMPKEQLQLIPLFNSRTQLMYQP